MTSDEHVTDRGFTHWDPIRSTHSETEVRFYESSAAIVYDESRELVGPFAWLSTGDKTAHLTAADVSRLHDYMGRWLGKHNIHFGAFHLRRDVDVTGFSGTGVVADGYVFPDGAAVVRWRGDHASTVVWDDVQQAIDVHGHGGATQFVWEEDRDVRTSGSEDGNA